MIAGRMPSRWLAVGAETDLLARARELQRIWERLVGEGALGDELSPEATAGLRLAILESWRRSLATGLDPTDLLAPIEADQSEVRERWLEHPLGSLAHVLEAQLRLVAEESRSLVLVTDASGMLLHLVGAEESKEGGRVMNLVEGALLSEAGDGTNGIGTPLAADHPVQVFAFEHFNQIHHEWVCAGAPVHDPVSRRTIGVIDLSSRWKIAHPRSLELVSTAARTIERCLLDNRRDQDARLRRRYGDLMTRSTDLLVNRDGYVLDGDAPRHSTPFDVPEGGGEVALPDGSVAIAEPLGDGEAYVIRRTGSRGAKSRPLEALERAEKRARELATEQAALRQVATLVARESSPDQLLAVVASQAARTFDVPLVKLLRYEHDRAIVVSGFSEGRDDPFPTGSRWPLDSPGVIASTRESGRPARVQDYARVPGQVAAVVRRSGMRSAVASPIVVEGRLWGAMMIASSRREPLPEDAEARLTDFSELVAMAIANAESRASVTRLADEQAALRRVAELVARGVDPKALFTAVSRELARLFGCAGAITRFEPDGSGFIIVGVSDGFRGTSIGERFAHADVLAGTRVYRTGRPARYDDIDRDEVEGPAANVVRELGLVSAVAAPIVVEHSLWGAVFVGESHQRLPADTEDRLEKFAGLVATAIANAESRAELASSEARAHDLAREQAALRRVATLVAEGTSADELFSAVTDEVGRLFGAQAAVARFEADGSGMVVVGLTSGIPVVSIGTRWPLEDFLASTAVYRTGRPARSDHTGHHDASGQVAGSLRQMKYVSTVAAPIMVEGSLWGVMTVSDQHEPLPPGTEERVAKFTELVGTAIANAESRAELAASEARAYDLAATQAALRRVATLVAEGATADELFAAVADEVAEVIAIPVVGVCRFEADDTFTMVGIAGETSFTVGSRWPVTEDGLAGMILATGRPARKDDYTTMAGPLGAAVQEDRMIATVGVPIVVEGATWGLIVGAARPGEPIPDGTEERLARFTQLVATAIANSQAREHLGRLADEQAALRRVATLVASGARPDEVFSAVSDEVGRLFGAQQATVVRFEPNGSGWMTVVGVSESARVVSVGMRWDHDDLQPQTMVYRTRRSARIERSSYEAASGPAADRLREIGVISAVAAPIVVEGSLWGAIAVGHLQERLPADAEARLEKFTELVATSIANTASRAELAASEARALKLAEGQASLRRVATLIARAAEADEVLSAVAVEVADVLDVQLVTVCRYETDGVLVLSSVGVPAFPAGSRWPLDVPSLPASIYMTRGPVRIDDFTDAEGLDAIARDGGVKSAVGVPIIVDGAVWGSVNTASTKAGPFPADAEERLARFTDLIATSVSNATMRAELAASRARVIAAADESRRRIERDLHDGAQQQLVTLAVALHRAQAKIPSGLGEVRTDVGRVAEGLTGALNELRDLSRGIHPAVLTKSGLSPALKALGRRSDVRVKLDVGFEHRLPDQVEVAAYYTVSEALTNASKHAGATRAWVTLREEEDRLYLSVRDDGAGGADPTRGSGLIGLRDRIEALGGTIEIDSPPGGGTRIDVEIPVSPPSG
jgi:GAF domain-containing protein